MATQTAIHHHRRMLSPLSFGLALLLLLATLWLGSWAPLPVCFGAIAASFAIGLGVFFAVPRAQRPAARRLALVVIGSSMLSAAVARTMANHTLFQIEGLWFELLAGTLGAGVVHYLLAKIVGPLLFGRVWCGWACWSALLFDLLPYRRSPGRLPGRWGFLRYAHLGLSLLVAALLALVVGYNPVVTGTGVLLWFLLGLALYDLAGVALALALKDNRAFCKYACPIAALMKLTSRFAVVKIAGDPAKCNQRGECVAVCPMDIRIVDYVQSRQRVLSTECILCQACVSTCPEQTLTLSVGADIGGIEWLRERPAARA